MNITWPLTVYGTRREYCFNVLINDKVFLFYPNLSRYKMKIRYHYSKSLMFSRISFSLYVVIRTWISGHKNVKFPNKLNHKFSHYNLYTHSTWALGEISTIKFIGCVWAHYFSKCKNVISWIVFRVVWHTYDENNNINKMLYAQKLKMHLP